MKFHTYPICLSASLILFGTSEGASASTISKREARNRVEVAQQATGALLQKFPAFSQLIETLKADCSLKVPENADSPTFCSCGAAVTLSLWLASKDQMVPKLADFASNPEPSKAAEFLDYQGPEMYGPLCKLAEP